MDSDRSERVRCGKDEHVLWMAIRRALLIVLGALEEYLGMERSVKPRQK